VQHNLLICSYSVNIEKVTNNHFLQLAISTNLIKFVYTNVGVQPDLKSE
jgi:hypothetical protein